MLSIYWQILIKVILFFVIKFDCLTPTLPICTDHQVVRLTLC